MRAALGDLVELPRDKMDLNEALCATREECEAACEDLDDCVGYARRWAPGQAGQARSGQ